MKFRNAVLLASSAAFLVSLTGSADLETGKASEEDKLQQFANEFGEVAYKDVLSNTPYAVKIQKLKEYGLLDLGDNFNPDSTISYGHLAYLLATSGFDFGGLELAFDADETVAIHEQSVEYLAKHGISFEGYDLNGAVTHEGLANISIQAFHLTDLASVDISAQTGTIKRSDLGLYLFNSSPQYQQTKAEANAQIQAIEKATAEATAEATTVAPAKDVSFKDLSKKHWAYEAIQDAVAKGYVNGYNDGTFKPENSVSSAEFLKMVAVALNPDGNLQNASGSEWYANYLKEAKAKGIIVGNEVTSANANQKVIRSDLAKFSSRAIGKTTTNDKEWFLVATSNGLIAGTDAKGTLNGNGSMTRAQAVMVIERVLKVNNGEKLPVDQNAVANAQDLVDGVVKDIKGHWAEATIKAAIKKGYVAGYSDGTFKPNNPISHSEFSKLLVVALGNDVPAVSGGSWYTPYLDKAVEQGYLTSADVANTVWNAQMSRTEVVKTGLSYLNIKPNKANKEWYEATKIGLMRGTDARGTLKSDGKLTRAEAITIVERVVALKAGQKLEVDQHAVEQAEVLYHRTNIYTKFPNFFNSEEDMDLINTSTLKQTYKNAYTDEILGYYIIDLADQNDPYYHMLKELSYFNGSEFTSIPKSGYVFLKQIKLTATSNPSKLATYNGAGLIFSLGNQNGLGNVKNPKGTYFLRLSAQDGAAKGSITTLYGSYYPLETIQKPKYFAIDISPPIGFGGSSTQVFTKYNLPE